MSSVKVADGTVAVGVIGSTNHFWRVSFKSTVNGGALAMGPLRLYAHDLSRTDGGGNGGSYGNGTYTDMSSAGITASQKALFFILTIQLIFILLLLSSGRPAACVRI